MNNHNIFILLTLSSILLSCTQSSTVIEDSATMIDEQAIKYNELGFDAMTSGKYDLCICYLDSALAIVPDYKVALINKCSALVSLGRLSEIEPILHKMKSIEPSNYTIPLGIGMYYDYTGKEKDAENYYKEAKHMLDSKKLDSSQMPNLWIVYFLCGNNRECQRIEKHLNRMAKTKDKEAIFWKNTLEEIKKEGKNSFLQSMFSPDEHR